jgi:hypothetical protein
MCYNFIGGFMKKNIIYISVFSLILLVIVLLSIYVMNVTGGSKYKFNDNVTKSDLIGLYFEDEKINLCENCLYTCSNWDSDNYSTMFKINNSKYEILENYDNVFTTNLDISIGDSYKKVLAYYGIKDNYAYWNVEFKNGDIAIYNYPNDVIKEKDVLNAYLKFVYYLEGDEWKLLPVGKYRNNSNDIIEGVDEYISFVFEFSFNGYKKVNPGALAAYSIMYYKK